MSAVFVTGTGTDVGKTFVATALIRHLRAQGRPIDALKPVVSGFDHSRLETSDPGLLLSALDRPAVQAELDRISPWRFAAPQSPDLAAQAEGRAIDFRALVSHCQEFAIRTRGVLLIEGVGGVMVPIDDRHTVLDWISALRLPVLLVTGSYLGTFSHTLTALHVLAHRNLDIAGVVVSESETPGATLDETVATIAHFAEPIEVIGLPRMPAGQSPAPVVLNEIERLLSPR